MSKNSISNSVIRRLPRYYRFLGELENNGYVRISSRELSEKMGLTASQIRQDFNCFGEFGQQGYGYNVSDLRMEIGKILGLDKRRLYFRVIGDIFDINEELIGKEIGELKVRSVDELSSFCAENKPVAAILCVPMQAAEKLANTLISCGIKAFWNFTHYDLKVAHKGVAVENVHLGDSLTTLSYCLNNIEGAEKE